MIRLLHTQPPRIRAATLAMTDDTSLPFSFPAVSRKKITASFDGGKLTSDGGVMLLAMADRRLRLGREVVLRYSPSGAIRGASCIALRI